MTELSDCQGCAALGEFCGGDGEHASRCRELSGWPEAVGGLALDAPLAPQPPFELPPFLPQLLNGLEAPAMIAREPAVAAGIAKALTPQGKVSRRAVPERYGTQSLRAQWGIGEETFLLCMGNSLDPYLERLWRAQGEENICGRLQGLGFDAATSLNFSIYLDRPRLEHLVNIKRTWLTVKGMQETSSLIPIPHLQWGVRLDLERQLAYAQSQGFHTMTLNLQMFKRQGWDTVLDGIAVIREHAPGLHFLIAGVAGLKRLAELAELLPTACFTNTTAHYLAQRYVRLQRDSTRLIKEPVDGHPDIILAENVQLYREFLAEVRGGTPQDPRARSRPRPSTPTFSTILQSEFGFDPGVARDAEALLAGDESILAAFQNWLEEGQLDRDFQGSFPTWPCSEVAPHPTLGELLDDGADSVEAFLHLGQLAHHVDEEIEVRVSQAGYWGGSMGWAKSSTTGRKRAVYQVGMHAPVPLREPALRLAGDWSRGEPAVADTTPLSTSAQPEEKRASKRNRRVLPVYDVATGQDLETPVNLDNTLLQAMFPDLAIAMGQVPPPPPCPRGKDPEVHMQEHRAAVLTDLGKDLGTEGMALDIATGGRKEGRFMFTDGQVGRMVADTHEKIMAYGGLLASPCLQPPKHVEGVRVLVVKEGEMGTGDCAGKVSRRLAALWGKDGSEAGQFRLGVRLDEDTILVGKGTLKAMDQVDVDAEGRGYDLILPDSSFKGNCPEFGEHAWDVYLGFNAWSTERRTRLSYQILQWFDPELVEQCIFPRADRRVPVLQEAMKDRDSACRFLRLEREDREAEVVENERGELEAADTREPSVLEQVLLADVTGQVFDHPYVQNGLRRRLREAWHELAVGGGVKVPSFMGLPDSFRGAVDWLPEGCIVCPDLPPGEVLATRYPIRTRHDIQLWRNLDWDAAFKMLHEGHPELKDKIDPLVMRSFFRYAERHKGVAFMSHATAKRVGGDFDGDVFQVMPVTPYKPLEGIKNPNRDWSDLAPLVDQVRREGWGQQGTTPKVKRRLATHVAPERPEKATEKNRKWLASAAIQQGGHREQFLVELGHHLDGQHLDPEKKQELAEALSAVASDRERSLDEAVEIAEVHGFDSHGWINQRESDLFGLARRYNREQAGRQALKNMDSALGQIVYTVSRVNASDKYTPKEREWIISRLAEELQAEVDKFKYDTGANLEYVNEVRRKVGRELVWLDVHKDPDIFVREAKLSPSQDAVSHLWNHVSRAFRAWERAPESPSHFKDMLPAEFSREQYAVARQKVKTYNGAVARAMQTDDDKAMVSAIQGVEEWSNSYTDPRERRVMAQAVWHAAHESTRPGGTASAAFHAFRPEMLSQLQKPQPRPSREVLILGPQHENNLGKEGAAYYDQPRKTRIRILLEDYTDTYGRTERRMAVYHLDDAGTPAGRIGYLPKDSPRREGNYIASLHRPVNRVGERGRIEGTLTPLMEYQEE